MTDKPTTLNPVALAEESGLVYSSGTADGDTPAYILLQLKKVQDDPESINVDVTTEGISEKGLIETLESIVKTLKSEGK